MSWLDDTLHDHPFSKQKKKVPGLQRNICREGLWTKDMLSFYLNYDVHMLLSPGKLSEPHLSEDAPHFPTQEYQ